MRTFLAQKIFLKRKLGVEKSRAYVKSPRELVTGSVSQSDWASQVATL